MRMGARVWAAIAVSLLIPAAAQARKIVVVGLAATEGVTPAEAARIGEAVAAATRDRGHEVLAPTAAARALGNEIVVSGRVARDPRSGELSVSLEAVDTESVRAVAEASHQAAGQAPEELDALARAVTTTLLDALPAPRRRARLSVTSEPSGAAVTINSRLMGETPWTGEVSEGPCTLLVELEAHTPQSRSFSLQADEVQEVHVALAESDGAGARRRRGPHAFDALDGALLGVAGVGVLGGALVAIVSVTPGEECVGEPDASGECRRVREAGNLWPWAGAIAVGVAAGAVVLVRLALGDALPVTPTVDTEARTVGVTGQF